MQPEVICPLCGGREVRTRFSASDLPVRECGCGMVFLYPHPAPAELPELYGPEYYRGWGGEGEGEGAARAMKHATFHRQLQLLAGTLAPGKVLDVGCATGHFLEAAAAAGWDVYGVELSQYAAAVAAKTFGSRVFSGTLEAAAYPDGFFDLVMLSDLLEHVPAPRSFLHEVRRVLSPDGRVMIVTPDVASLSAKLMGRRWSHYHQEHLHYFSARTATRLLVEAGFTVQYRCSAIKYLNVSYVAAQLKSHAHPLLTPLARLADALLPAALRRCNLPVRCGQMLMLAKPGP